MRKLIGLTVVLSWVAIQSFGQAPAKASDILHEACQQAAAQNKNVFILFHASWCGWCHKMDSSMNDAAIKKYFDDNYVICHLVVYESKGKENLENPGALELLKTYHGEDQGIPYWMIFDKDGNLLADSKLRNEGEGLDKGENTGCPSKPDEVVNFIKILKSTSHLEESAIKAIGLRFRQNDTPATH